MADRSSHREVTLLDCTTPHRIKAEAGPFEGREGANFMTGTFLRASKVPAGAGTLGKSDRES